MHTLRNWEQGRRNPEGPALALLRIAARHPGVLRENLASSIQDREHRLLTVCTFVHILRLVHVEWDRRKAAANRRKHGVDFADAVAVLYDELAVTIQDEHPDEERFITIGADALGQLLVVVWTSQGERLRLISARRATPRERRQYEV